MLDKYYTQQKGIVALQRSLSCERSKQTFPALEVPSIVC